MYQFLIVLIFAACVNGAKEKTECEKHRERETNSRAPLPMRLIPECDENGDYKPLQCFKDSNFCACWDKTGEAMTDPSNKIKACDCIVQRETTHRKRLIGAYAPQCQEDGKYTKIQCHGSTGHCWCAEEHSGAKITEPTRGKLEC
uniref:U56-Theraphotoxin-Sfo1a_1 n=1 Tax=Selenotholus foelschei TaxID=1905327 RepID=A0A482ZC70_9ARAC